MILPDDLDEKAEIRVGETDTEEEFDEEDYRGNGEIKLVLREMKQRPKVKRHRSSRRHPNQHHHQHPHERIQLGNGLQLSLGRRKSEDVFILKQEFKGLQPSSAHNSPRRTPEGSPRKPSPRRHAAAAVDESHHHRPWTIRPSTNNPTGLGLNIWPNHSFFSRASSSSQPANTNPNTNTKRDEQRAESVTDTAIRIEQPSSSDVNSFMESPRVRSTLREDDEVEEDKKGSGSDDDRKKHNETQSNRRTGGWWWPLWPWHTTSNSNRIRGGERSVSNNS